jgi:hypothetical protein
VACARVLVGEVPDGGAQAVVRGSARCATQALTRDVQADARGTAQVLDRGAQAVARGTARCASQVPFLAAPVCVCRANYYSSS